MWNLLSKPCFTCFSRCLCLIFGLLMFSPNPSWALPGGVSGHVDVAHQSAIAGWAKDADLGSQPSLVHIYINGKLAHHMHAETYRSDVGAHAFHWTPPYMGPGNHQVQVFVIDINGSGQPSHSNPLLPGASTWNLSNACAYASGTPMADPSAGWCTNLEYYSQRTAVTDYLYGDNLRLGINRSLGGAIFEFYGQDHSRNLIYEHGGAALQLSLWGRTPGQTNVPSADRCVSGWGPNPTFNPLQAQAPHCGWTGTGNDVDWGATSPRTSHVQLDDPWQFTRGNQRIRGLRFEQHTALNPAIKPVYAQLTHHVVYDPPEPHELGPNEIAPKDFQTHDQEIPAIFPGFQMNHTYFLYSGTQPYTGGSVTAIHVPTSQDPNGTGLFFQRSQVRRSNSNYPVGSGYDNPTACMTEHWISVCDAAGAAWDSASGTPNPGRCLTVATFDSRIGGFKAYTADNDGWGHLTPTGRFALTPDFDEQWVTYLFPARYDEKLTGDAGAGEQQRTVRNWVKSLRGNTSAPGQCKI